MSKGSKNILRIISIIIVIVVTLMKLAIVTTLFSNEGEFWMMLVAYGMLVFTLRT